MTTTTPHTSESLEQSGETHLVAHIDPDYGGVNGGVWLLLLKVHPATEDWGAQRGIIEFVGDKRHFESEELARRHAEFEGRARALKVAYEVS